MTYEVIVTAAAKQDLRNAYLWAAERAPFTAALWLHRFEVELETLARFPKRFQLAPENGLVDVEIRQFIYGRRLSAYRVLYTIDGNQVKILHIRRAARDLASADDLISE